MANQTVTARGAVRLLASIVVAAVAAIPLAAQADRNTDRIESDRTVIVPGHVNSRSQAGIDGGQVEGSFLLHDLTLTLKPSPSQQADLDTLLAAQQDPASPEFHNWLTPEQFAERFGPGPGDIAKIAAWLEEQGFTVHSVAASRNWIGFSGTAEIAQRAFGVEIHRFTVAGESHFATVAEPAVPSAIADLVAGFRGFDDFLPRHPRLQARAAFTYSNGKHFMGPNDAATIYNVNTLYTKGYDGTGQTIAIVGQSAINLSDIDNFRALFGLAKNDPKLVTVPGFTSPGIVSGDVLESDLDIEWAGSVAKNASVVFVYTSNVFNSLQYAVTQNLAPVISISYGACETGEAAEGAALRAIAQQANAQGITLFSASGDTGAFACDSSGSAIASDGVSVNLPASIPEVTAVGGTQFNEGNGSYWSATNNSSNGSALSYIPEAVWNESAQDGSLVAGGGGASVLFGKPVWQAGSGVPNDGARDLPDVAMAASADHDGAIVCTSGGCANGIAGASVVGGTSLATPIFAGIATLLNQYQVGSGTLTKAGLGNVNPTLYAMAQSFAGVFNDITTGNNTLSCRTGTPGCTTGSFGYSAGVGYDQATGLGSVNAYAMATNWSLVKSTPVSLSSVSVSPATLVTGATATVTVSLSAAAPSGGATVALSGGSAVFPLPASVVVPAGQSSASVNVKAGAAASSSSVTVTATYSGAAKTAVVTVAPAPTASLVAVSVSQASVASGATDTVTVTLSAAAPAGGATVTLSSSSAAFSLPATLAVPPGAMSAIVSAQAAVVSSSTPVTIMAKYNGGTQTAGITITPAAPLPTLSSVSVSPASVSGGSAATLNLTLSAAAPAGGAVVAIVSNSAAFPLPANVVVLAGQKTASLTVTTSSVAAPASATVTAKYNGGTQTATVTVTPVVLPSLSSLTVSQASVAGGATVVVTVSLGAAAPTGGSSVTLSSSSAAFPAPASIVVPAGQSSASVNVISSGVSASTAVTVTAKYNGGTKTASLTLTPAVLPSLTSIAISQAAANGNGAEILTVTLSAAAPTGGSTVMLSSSNRALTVPAGIVVPAGAKSVSGIVEAAAVTASTTVTLTATYNGGSKTATVTLVPVVVPTLATLSASPASVKGGTIATLSVALSGPAPAGGSVISLTSSSAALPLPASVLMPAGAASGWLQVETRAVTAPITVTITGTSGGASRTATLTVTP